MSRLIPIILILIWIPAFGEPASPPATPVPSTPAPAASSTKPPDSADTSAKSGDNDGSATKTSGDEATSTPPVDGFTPTTTEETPVESQQPQTPEAIAEQAKAKAINKKLLEKLKGADGAELAIGVLTTVDQTPNGMGEFVARTLLRSVQRYGHEEVRLHDVTPEAVNLESFRTIVLQTKDDLVIASLIKTTECQLFLFDKRTPYQIYYYSQDFPEEVQLHLTNSVVEEYLNQALRRLLYSFLQNDSFETPREIATATLKGEVIPYWIARPGLVTLVNHETLSSMYGGVTIGGALAVGYAANSSLFGIQYGFRFMDDWSAELGLESFTYNALSLSLKRTFTFPDNPLQVISGVGAAYLFSEKAVGYDASYLPHLHKTYIVASAAVVFPIVEVFIKFATEVFFNPAQPGVMVTIGPGFFMRF